MSLLDKKDYSLDTLKKMKSLMEQVKALEPLHDDLVTTSYGGDVLFWAKYKREEYNFYFKITKPTTEKERPSGQLKISSRPTNTNAISGGVYEMKLEEIISDYKKWIYIISEYEALDLDSIENNFTKQYENEIFEEFNILDDDASTKAFEEEKQFLLYKYLTYVEEQLRLEDQNNPETIELLNEATELKENIQKQTKRQFVKGLSKFLARSKKFRLKLYSKIKDELLKTIIKAAIDELPNLAHRLNEFVHHNPHNLLS